ncbi:hypothetical protein LIER_13396 [Lithospermum erythrorhizon]|uniref:Uncharacterized protein n=1 Tax=Lithospermum erythrorhizon TaxID=34254 RepID=A0AAV3PXF6_LITER
MDSISVSIEDDNSSNLIDGFWLKVFYDVVPTFCSSCLHLGHSLDTSQVFEELPEPAYKKLLPLLVVQLNTSNKIQNLLAENCFDALKFPVADLDENIQGTVAEIDTNIAKADLSSLDPARSNSVLLQIASEDKKGLDPTTQVDCSIDSVPPCLLDKSPVVESQKIVTTGIPSGGRSTETTVNLQLICGKTVKKAEVKGGEQHKAKTGKKIELPVAASAQAVKQKQIEDVQDLHNSQSLSSQHLRAEDTSDKGKELRLENSFGSLVLPGLEKLFSNLRTPNCKTSPASENSQDHNLDNLKGGKHTKETFNGTIYCLVQQFRVLWMPNEGLRANGLRVQGLPFDDKG